MGQLTQIFGKWPNIGGQRCLSIINQTVENVTSISNLKAKVTRHRNGESAKRNYWSRRDEVVEAKYFFAKSLWWTHGQSYLPKIAHESRVFLTKKWLVRLKKTSRAGWHSTFLKNPSLLRLILAKISGLELEGTLFGLQSESLRHGSACLR